MRFPPFSEDAGRHLWTSVDSVEEVERTVRTWMKKQNLESFLDGFRNLVHRWRIGCGEWRWLCGEGSAGDKRVHFKNYFRVSSIKISLFKQKSRWRHYFSFSLVWNFTAHSRTKQIFVSLCFTRLLQLMRWNWAMWLNAAVYRAGGNRTGGLRVLQLSLNLAHLCRQFF